MIRRLRDRHRRLITIVALLSALTLAWALLSPVRTASPTPRAEPSSR
jgi:hypothetical protein